VIELLIKLTKKYFIKKEHGILFLLAYFFILKLFTFSRKNRGFSYAFRGATSRDLTQNIVSPINNDHQLWLRIKSIVGEGACSRLPSVLSPAEKKHAWRVVEDRKTYPHGKEFALMAGTFHFRRVWQCLRCDELH
jgi:hypothetical protein